MTTQGGPDCNVDAGPTALWCVYTEAAFPHFGCPKKIVIGLHVLEV